MGEANDYFDFTDRLSKIASDPKCAPELVYMAMLHSWLNGYNIGLYKIEEAHPDNPILKPWFIEEPMLITAAVEEALETNPNDAVRFYLYMRVLRVSEIGTTEENWAQDQIEKMLKNNKGLRGHSAFYYYQMGRHHRYEGTPKNALEYHNRALKLAKKYDDKRLQVLILFMMAELTGFFQTGAKSHRESEAQIREAKTIAESINYKAGLGVVLNHLSIKAMHQGEIDEAIDCQLEGFRITEVLGNEDYAGARNLVGMYASIGDTKSAMEWAKLVYDNWKDSPGLAPYADFAMMQAYMAMDDLDKAREHLDDAKEKTFQSGYEMALGAWYGAAGSLDMKSGDFESAKDNYLKALDINERANRQMRMNGCISNLTRIELEMYNPTKENQDDELSGPWMKRLAQVLEEKDTPASHAELMLWKAELRMKQGRHDEADAFIESAVEITDRPGTRSLQKKALKMREEWVERGLVVPKPSYRKRR